MSRRSRCGQCEGCLREDCGICEHCVDKKKFGGTGAGKARKVCIHRRCRDLQHRENGEPLKAPPPTTGKRKAPDGHEPNVEEPTIHYRIPDSMYGIPIQAGFVTGVCAGCNGRKNENLKDDPIVLCDGKGCGREYHLQCCLPPLTLEEVPEGAYLCIDCDPSGTSKHLEEYFDNVWEARANFNTSRDFVVSLLQGDERIPVSEFPRISTLHRDAIAGIRNLRPASMPDDVLSPDFLIGKPLRLYCPNGNSYHSGRILDYRYATPNSSSSQSEASDFQYGELSEFARCEFLVTFPAGLDYRKKTVTQWLILEEHSLAVGTSLVWAFDGRKKDWLPGITWLRTSLEIKPILDRLSESDGQVIFHTSRIGETESWALTQIFGKEAHLLTILREETIDLFSPYFIERISRKTETTEGPRVDFATMLAHIEIDEQRRIRQWSRLPLKNAAHERALSIVDKYTLPPLQAMAEKSSEPQDEIVVELGPRPCPLIREGLDRACLMDQLEARGVDQSKDVAAALTVRPVKSWTAAIQQLQRRTKGESK